MTKTQKTVGTKPQEVINVVLQEEVMTTGQIATMLGLTERTILDKIRLGDIPAYKKYKSLYCLKSDIVAWIKTTPNKPPTEKK